MNGAEAAVEWVAVLDRLEEHLTLTERAVADQIVPPTESWEPPTGIAPLPDVFLARARNLLNRQQALIDVIPTLMTNANDQRRVLHRIDEATGQQTRPVYLDIAT